MPAVKGGVEAGHLNDPRISLGQRPHRPQVVRLVEWGERNEALERGQHGGVHDHRRRVAGTPVRHPVTHGDQVAPGILLPQPGAHAAHGGSDVRNFSRAERLIRQGRAAVVAGAEPRVRADAVDLAPGKQCRRGSLGDGVHAELQTRRAGVDDEQQVHDATQAATAARSRRACA